jgi:hypothetical protein
MNPTIKAIRAIGSEFALRIFKPIVIIFVVSAAVLLGVNVYLITLSVWWWILFVLLLLLTLLGSTIAIIIGIVIATVKPAQTKGQTTSIKSFVDKIENLRDVAGTPKPVILFRVVRDIVSKRDDSYTKRISSETLSMQSDLRDIISSFK